MTNLRKMLSIATVGVMMLGVVACGAKNQLKKRLILQTAMK